MVQESVGSDHGRCGSCNACCVYLPIAAGVVGRDAKPAGAACPHLCGTACSIYAARPSSCASFECAWFTDRGWPANWRPDRNGLLCLRESLGEDLTVAVIYETRAGALVSAAGKEIVERLHGEVDAVVIVDAQGARRVLLRRRNDENALIEAAVAQLDLPDQDEAVRRHRAGYVHRRPADKASPSR